MYALRPYQEDAVASAVRFFKGTKPGYNGLMVEPQGAGKSLIIASIVQQLPGRCLIFQPSKEILEQNASKLQAFGFSPAVYSASVGLREVGAITLATIGSVKNVPGLFQDVPFIIMDECHGANAEKGMYLDFFKSLPGSRLVGLTATPYRLSRDNYGGSMLKFLTRTRPSIFKEVIHYTQIGDLIAAGWLTCPTYQHVSGFKPDELEVNTTGSDYTDESVRRVFNKVGFADRLRRVVERLLSVGRKNVLVFTRFVEEAEQLAQALPGVAVVNADTHPKTRSMIVEGFRSGEIQVAANVNCLATGFDYPELDTVVLAAPTLSLSRYMQQVGRITRIAPGKTDAWVVDMVDQVRQFGQVEHIRIKPTGKSGRKWIVEDASRRRELTNVYFGKKKEGWGA